MYAWIMKLKPLSHVQMASVLSIIECWQMMDVYFTVMIVCTHSMETLTKFSIESSEIGDLCDWIEYAFKVPCLKTKGYLLWDGPGFFLFCLLFHKLMLYMYQRQVRKMVDSLEQERYAMKKASG